MVGQNVYNRLKIYGSLKSSEILETFLYCMMWYMEWGPLMLIYNGNCAYDTCSTMWYEGMMATSRIGLKRSVVERGA